MVQDKRYEELKEKLKEWHGYVVNGLCSGLSHTHRDGREQNIEWMSRRLKLFESFSRCVMDFEWENDYKDYHEKELKEVAKEGFKWT